ncbi:MAG: right-handed parallel beta-helix repeat-containing protein, partial [bacterium]|nr:right-handed parallel beta-helix repeat-containing protein [bacterium]
MKSYKCIINLFLVVCCIGATLSATATLNAATYYVSVSGSDSTGTGTESNPWRTVRRGVSSLIAPGDTLMIRGGLYRELNQIYNFYYSGTSAAPITVKAYPGEKVTVSGMNDISGTGNWVQESGNIYRYSSTISGTVYNVSQNGIPLKLMVPYNNYSGSPANLTGEGQWTRNSTTGQIWVWARGGGNPGSYTLEYSPLVTVFRIQDSISYITFENLTVEGPYYPVICNGDYCTFKNCTFRNVFGDAFKVEDGCVPGGWNATNGQLINCDLYYFGENGVDITGGDYWTVKNCTIHDGVKNRAPSEQSTGSKLNAVMLKNNNIGTIVEGCRIYNIDGPFGAVAIGGDTYYTDPDTPPAEDLIIRNNIIHGIKAPFVVSFYGARNSVFANNIIYDCDVTNSGVAGAAEALVLFTYGLEDHNPPYYTYFACTGNTVLNNVFYDNTATYNYKETDDGVHGSNDNNLTLDYGIVDSNLNSYFDGTSMSHSTMVSIKGYDADSQTGTPAFADYANGLVRLASSSIGIDDGMSLSDIAYDYDAITRFLGAASDIGPFEKRAYSVYSDGSITTGWVNLIPNIVTDTTLGSSVLSFTSTGLSWLFNSSGQSWNNTTQFVLTWKAKADVRHTFSVRLKTKAGVWKTIKYYSWYTTPDLSNATLLRFPLGTGTASTQDNNWHTYTFDLQAALQQALSTDEIDLIERFYVENVDSSDVRVDDIELHNTLQSAQTPRGSIGEWNFNEAFGSKVADISGQDRHGTFTNMSASDPAASVWTMGRLDKALQFATNANSYVSI